MNDIRTPVAAVRYGPSTTSWTNGNETMPARALQANERDTTNTSTTIAIDITVATGVATSTVPRT